MRIFLRCGWLRQLVPRRNESLSLTGQLRGVHQPPDSFQAGGRPANDSEAALLGAIARKASADRRRRSQIAGTSDLFGEPAWDILLNLFIAACEGRRLSLAALCSSAGAPESTALRWIAVLEKRGMIVREGDLGRTCVKLSAPANASLADYFANS